MFILSFPTKSWNVFFLFSLSTQIKGNCYVWSLIPGTKLPDGEEGSTPTQLRPKSRLLAHKRYGLKCKFSPDAKYVRLVFFEFLFQSYNWSRRYLATTSADQTAKLWKTSDFSLHSTLQTENQRWVWDIAFSADSQYAITGTWLFYSSSWLCLPILMKHFVYPASSDNTARLWSIETSEIAKEYIGHSKALTSLAFQDGTP